MRGLAILLAFYFAGALLHAWFIPLPGNVIGFILLVFALCAGWIKLSWIEETAQFLLKHMLLFFTPVIVGVGVIFSDYRAQWLPIVVSLFVGTFVVMLTTGWFVQGLLKKSKEKKGGECDGVSSID
ncbi:CidA/LrgA family protein [Caldalkalibacillus mannanilyticus]|uniref:CidA/LrgA family protein n=1 Tax=Caldalkalibacillus mannanilyticus TaxID=1418 RepID=UPI00046A12D2|nr:CidA/LrgA family protein [Caldalkalibacillus mannanilyticus]